MSPYLLGRRMISLDGDHPVSLILKGLSPSLILVSAGSIVMVRAINPDADARSPGSSVVRIRLDEYVSGRRVLGKIGEAEPSLV